MKQDKTTKQASKHLGKNSKYSCYYDSSLLVRIDREENRGKYGIKREDFFGWDVWNCYECSFLLPNSLPFVCKLKITYPSHSKYIVESKSLKLYLNSMNNNPLVSFTDFEKIVRQDLSSLLECDVNVKCFFNEGTKKPYDRFTGGTKLELILNQSDKPVIFPDFNGEDATLLIPGTEETEEQHIQHFSTELLRSNCRVTGQPDWGSCFITISSHYKINPISLLKYLVSFRTENHFHEEVVEMIYKRLQECFNPQKLMVGAIYTRRGGIDICPVRVSDVELLDDNLIDVNCNTEKIFRQ